jgi:L-asparaginase
MYPTPPRDIQANFEAYDGFVVLHGTDTMAFTASAMSFMFKNLSKTVIITGSQISMAFPVGGPPPPPLRPDQDTDS